MKTIKTRLSFEFYEIVGSFILNDNANYYGINFNTDRMDTLLFYEDVKFKRD